jgi:hypothetical protein
LRNSRGGVFKREAGSASREKAGRAGLSLFKGMAGAAKPDKSMGVVQACAPVARGIEKLLLGYEMPAVAAFERLVVNLVIACLLKTGERSFHPISQRCDK